MAPYYSATSILPNASGGDGHASEFVFLGDSVLYGENRQKAGLTRFGGGIRNSAFHPDATHYFFEGDRLGAAGANGREALLGEVAVFKIVQVLEYRYAGVESLGATGALGEAVEAFFDGCG